MSRKKYQTFNYECKEIANRDELISAIKDEDPAIIFDSEIDKALNMTLKNSEKTSSRKTVSLISMFGSMILSFVNPVFIVTFLGGAVGSIIGKDELKKYQTYKAKINGKSYVLLLHIKKVNIKLDTILYHGKKVM